MNELMQPGQSPQSSVPQLSQTEVPNQAPQKMPLVETTSKKWKLWIGVLGAILIFGGLIFLVLNKTALYKGSLEEALIPCGNLDEGQCAARQDCSWVDDQLDEPYCGVISPAPSVPKPEVTTEPEAAVPEEDLLLEELERERPVTESPETSEPVTRVDTSGVVFPEELMEPSAASTETEQSPVSSGAIEITPTPLTDLSEILRPSAETQSLESPVTDVVSPVADLGPQSLLTALAPVTSLEDEGNVLQGTCQKFGGQWNIREDGKTFCSLSGNNFTDLSALQNAISSVSESSPLLRRICVKSNGQWSRAENDGPDGRCFFGGQTYTNADLLQAAVDISQTPQALQSLCQKVGGEWGRSANEGPEGHCAFRGFSYTNFSTLNVARSVSETPQISTQNEGQISGQALTSQQNQSQTDTGASQADATSASSTAQIQAQQAQIENLQQQLAAASNSQNTGLIQSLTSQISSLQSQVSSMQNRPSGPISSPAPIPTPGYLQALLNQASGGAAGSTGTAVQTQTAAQTGTVPVGTTAPAGTSLPGATAPTGPSSTLISTAGGSSNASSQSQGSAATSSGSVAVPGSAAQSQPSTIQTRPSGAAIAPQSGRSLTSPTAFSVTSQTAALQQRGSFIQGQTGPGFLLYPIVISAANGLYYIARKRKRK